MYKETKKICISAFLVALGVVFSRLLSIPVNLAGAYSLNFGFGMLPILLLCVLYGPIYGAIGAAAWDLIGAWLFPQGGFVIWFTVAAFVFGAVTGLLFIKHTSENPIKIFCGVAMGEILYSVILNTLIIHILYHVPIKVLLIPRAIENAIMIFVNTALVTLLIKVIRKTNIVADRFPVEKREGVIK